MIVATAVWIAYIFITGMGIEGEFTQKLSSPEFEFQLTNGAVFGFAAGLIAFFASYVGERISERHDRTTVFRRRKPWKKSRPGEKVSGVRKHERAA